MMCGCTTVWMYDNEGGMQEMVKELAKMWNTLLKNSDDVLEIDAAAL